MPVVRTSIVESARRRDMGGFLNSKSTRKQVARPSTALADPSWGAKRVEDCAPHDRARSERGREPFSALEGFLRGVRNPSTSLNFRYEHFRYEHFRYEHFRCELLTNCDTCSNKCSNRCHSKAPYRQPRQPLPSPASRPRQFPSRRHRTVMTSPPETTLDTAMMGALEIQHRTRRGTPP